jgi:hypothetical protein
MGLIEAAVQWLTGTGPIPTGWSVKSGKTTYSNATASNVDTNASNDVGGVPKVVDATTGANSGTTVTGDYTASPFAFGAITLTASGGGKLMETSLAPSSDAWSEQSGTLFSASTWMDGFTGQTFNNLAVTSDGEGLKNALQAYNMGQLVASLDGNTIGWQTSSGIVDVHQNTAGAFWGVLYDAQLAGAGQTNGIVGKHT